MREQTQKTRKMGPTEKPAKTENTKAAFVADTTVTLSE